MTFSEMLNADGEQGLLKYLKAKSGLDPIPDAFFSPLTENLKKYFLIGVMPEAVER